MHSVFLGGTCNGSTWRQELLSMLDTNKIEAFNPVVENWNEEAQRNEDYHKENDDYSLYVITPEMKGIYSIFEVAQESVKNPDKILFCVLTERDGKIFDPFLLKNFDKIKRDLVNNGVKVFNNLEEISFFLNNLENNKSLHF